MYSSPIFFKGALRVDIVDISYQIYFILISATELVYSSVLMRRGQLSFSQIDRTRKNGSYRLIKLTGGDLLSHFGYSWVLAPFRINVTFRPKWIDRLSAWLIWRRINNESTYNGVLQRNGSSGLWTKGYQKLLESFNLAT